MQIIGRLIDICQLLVCCQVTSPSSTLQYFMGLSGLIGAYNIFEMLQKWFLMITVWVSVV